MKQSKNQKSRLFEIMAKIDKSFKKRLNENIEQEIDLDNIKLLDAYYDGNGFHFKSQAFDNDGTELDYNFHAKFMVGDKTYHLVEEIGSTQSGEFWRSVVVKDNRNSRVIDEYEKNDDRGSLPEFSDYIEQLLHILQSKASSKLPTHAKAMGWALNLNKREQ